MGLNIDDIGQIGQGKWKEGARITVATVQTIWKKYKDGLLDDGFFDEWDCVIVDECHHVTAETIQVIVGSFNAKYRFGVSATPDRKDDKFEFALDVLGEVFWQDDEEELRAAGMLMRPLVRVIRTDFNHVYWPDHSSDENHDCMTPGCRLSGKRPHEHRNNYQAVKTALVENEPRNWLIAETLAGELGPAASPPDRLRRDPAPGCAPGGRDSHAAVCPDVHDDRPGDGQEACDDEG